MKPCNFEQQIGPYHDGELDSARAATVESHLEVCTICAEQLAELRRLSGAVATIDLPPISQIEHVRLCEVAQRLPMNLAERAVMRMAMSLAAVAASLLLITSLCLLSANRASAADTSSLASNMPASPVEIPAPHASPSVALMDQDNSNLSHWMVRNLGGDQP